MKRILLLVTLNMLFLYTKAENKSQDAFIENKGQIKDQNQQTNNQVLYLYNSAGLNVQLRKTGFSYDIWADSLHDVANTEMQPTKTPSNPSLTRSFHRIDFEFVGTNENMAVISEEPSDHYTNYYIEDAAFNGIHGYNKITYRNVWDNIDIVFTFQDQKSKYNIILHPGADIANVRFRIRGAAQILNEDDGLLLKTSITDVHERVPYSYIELNGKRSDVRARMYVIADDIYGFSTGQNMPVKTQMVIDPVPDIVWANYIGGSNGEEVNACATDATGNIYITGWTSSATNIATAGAFQTSFFGAANVFISKFNTNGAIVWSTYYGGSAYDIGYGITVEPAGQNIYVAGLSTSTNTFGTSGSHQQLYGGSDDAFLCKFDANGSRVWSTYYGGTNLDYATSVALDAAGDVYIAGRASSTTGIATPGTHQQTIKGDNGFLAKFTPAGQRLWATYYGGIGETTMYIAGILSDSLYIVGTTDATTDIATTGTYQTVLAGLQDAFIVKFNTAGTRYWGSYYGGNALENTNAGSIDAAGNIYMVGRTRSTSDIASPGALQAIYGGKEDGFAAKFDGSGNRVWSTYYGGSEYDDMRGVALHNNSLMLVGATRSPNNIATPGTFDPAPISNPNVQRTVIALFDENGNRKLATYFGKVPGTAPGNMANAVTRSTNNSFVIVGGTEGMPLSGITTPYQGTYGGGTLDGFILKLTECPASFATASSNSPVKLGNTINLSASGGLSYSWSHNSGFNSILQSPSITGAVYSDSGVYTVVVKDQFNCTDTVLTRVLILSPDGIRDMQHQDILQVYPNPAHGYLHIDGGENIIGRVQITDHLGKDLLEVIVNSNWAIISVASLPPGSYLFKASFKDSKVVYRKILISK